MTVSYSEDPSDSEKDEIRYKIGDTDTDNALLTDEEINFVLGRNSDIYSAAADCCDAIVAKYSRRADSSVFGDLDVDLSQVVEQYRELAGDFRKKSLASQIPYAGGISESDKSSKESDTDRVTPRFERGLHDNDN